MPEITPSKTYLHKLNELQTEHLERRITDEEYSQRVDELNEQEAKSHELLGPALIKQELANIEKENELKVKEELRRKEREREAEEWARQLEKGRQRRIEDLQDKGANKRWIPGQTLSIALLAYKSGVPAWRVGTKRPDSGAARGVRDRLETGTG